MESLINRIKDEIKGEQLLFEGRKEYTDSEKQLIIKAVASRIEHQECYIDLIVAYLPRLINNILKSSNYDNLEEEITSIKLELGKYRNKSFRQRDLDADFAVYTSNVVLGHKWGEAYSSVMTREITDIDKMKKFLDDGTAYDVYNNDMNFIVTTNLLLTRYPEFFSDSYLSQVGDIANHRNSKKFGSFREYLGYKKACKQSLKNIETAKRKGYIKVQ